MDDKDTFVPDPDENPRITPYDSSTDPVWPEDWSSEPTERDKGVMK